MNILDSASKSKSKGEGKKGQWNQESSVGGQWQGSPHRQDTLGNRQPWPQLKVTGRVTEKCKGKSTGKGKNGGKAKTYFVRGGVGHSARLCSSEGWVHDRDEDALEGEDTNEDGCWTRNSNLGTLAAILV